MSAKFLFHLRTAVEFIIVNLKIINLNHQSPFKGFETKAKKFYLTMGIVLQKQEFSLMQWEATIFFQRHFIIQDPCFASSTDRAL